MRVAYVDEDVTTNKDGTAGKIYYSALVKADPQETNKDLVKKFKGNLLELINTIQHSVYFSSVVTQFFQCLELLTELIHLSAAHV